MKNAVVVLTTGYVESSSLASVAWVGIGSFDTPKDAVTDLSRNLFESYLLEYECNTKPWKCCRETLEKIEDASFCAGCKRTLTPVFDFEEYMNWCAHLNNGTHVKKKMDKRTINKSC